MTTRNLSQYHVLARKYRPRQFSELLGQDVLVRVISNAVKFNRLPHAFILTGVRGVGKTTTARIIARMLNCVGIDGRGRETIEPCGQCPQCQAIAQDCHLDVIEMDAASRTGVDDIREIIDATYYKAVFGRYKVYIIDEVHMLSKNAFNALLKTLEEPPEHIKFIFATTEIKKVPDTVLSRCAHFELKRLTDSDLQKLFTRVLDQEHITIEATALQLLSRAAQGSARDGLSLLDQALNIDRHQITEQGVRTMLNITDRGALILLMRHLLQGRHQYCLNFLQDYYYQGNDPGHLIGELLDICNHLSLLKTYPQSVDNALLTVHEIELGDALEKDVGLPVLVRFWQVLLKGYDEINQAPSRMQVTQMIFIRLCYMAHLPTPQQALEHLTIATPNTQPINLGLDTKIASDTATADQLPHSHQHIDDETAEPQYVTQDIKASNQAPLPQSFKELIDRANQDKEVLLVSSLYHDVHLIDYQPGHIKMRLGEHATRKFVVDLKKYLQKSTGITWGIEICDAGGAASLTEQKQQVAHDTLTQVKKHPLIIAALTQFPDAVIGKIEENKGK